MDLCQIRDQKFPHFFFLPTSDALDEDVCFLSAGATGEEDLLMAKFWNFSNIFSGILKL